MSKNQLGKNQLNITVNTKEQNEALKITQTAKVLKDNFNAFVQNKEALDNANTAIKFAKPTMTEVAKKILTDLELGFGTVNFDDTNSKVKIAISEDVKIKDVDDLETVLGKKEFLRLTDQKVVYTPTQELLQLAQDDPRVQELLVKKEKVTFTKSKI
jgi:hypothetical protein